MVPLPSSGDPVRVVLFGSPDLDGPEGARDILRTPKRLALAAYLLARVPEERVQRDTLAWLFWPESDHDRARNALNQALHVLRKALGHDALRSEGDQVLADPTHVRSDVQEFELARAQGHHAEAAGLYRADLLEGFHVAGLRDVQAWIEEERRALRRKALRSFWLAAAEAELSGRLDEAVHLARRGVALAPFEEEAARRLVALHLRRGDRGAALQAYRALSRRMEAELGIGPGERTRAIGAALEAGRDPDPRPETPGELLGSDRGEASFGEDPAHGKSGPPMVGPPTDSGGSRPSQPGSRPDRTGSSRWKGAVLVGLAVTAAVALLAPDGGSRPVLEGTVAVIAADAERASAAGPVIAATVSLLSRAGFPLDVRVLEPGSADADGPATEGVLRVEERDGTVTGTLVRGGSGQVLGSVVVDAGMPPARSADRLAGLVALHMDPRTAAWGPGSSVVPGYRAWMAFQEGLLAWREQRNGDSRRALEEAVALEPWFPLALLELAEVQITRAPPEDSLLRRLSAGATRLSDVERSFLTHLEMRYARDRHGALEAALRLLPLLPRRFIFAATSGHVDLGRYTEALELADRYDAEASIVPNAHWGTLQALHGLGRHEEELSLVQELRHRHPEERLFVFYEAQALAALGRHEQLRTLLTQRAGRPEPVFAFGDLSVRRTVVDELRLHGHEDAARALVDDAVEYLDSESGAEVSAMLRADLYRRAGRWETAAALYRQELERWPDWPGRYRVMGGLALVAAHAGDPDAARSWERRLAAGDFPPRVEAGVLKARALIHSVLGQPDDAVRLLTRALAAGLSHVQIRTGVEFQKLRGHPAFDRLVPASTF